MRDPPPKKKVSLVDLSTYQDVHWDYFSALTAIIPVLSHREGRLPTLIATSGAHWIRIEPGAGPTSWMFLVAVKL